MKKRLDRILFERGMFESIEKARISIMEGLIYTDGELLTKPGMEYKEDINLYVKGKNIYASRGGLKLEKAIKEFNIDLKNKVMLDVGCSTGGFTDVALNNGIKKVYALDVGTNCLAYNIRTNEKVVVMENTNFRNSEKEDFDSKIDFITFDVSFISLKLMLEPLKRITDNNCEIVALIKPQFEALREDADKNKGVITDSNVQIGVIKDIINEFEKNEFMIQNLSYSPIKGRKGNIEFLAYFIYKSISKNVNISEIVKEAHENLD